jgi:hypothetical protein
LLINHAIPREWRSACCRIVTEPATRPDAELGKTIYSYRYVFLRKTVAKAADLLSGPGGLASFLRTRQLGARLAGFSRAIPPGTATP